MNEATQNQNAKEGRPRTAGRLDACVGGVCPDCKGSGYQNIIGCPGAQGRCHGCNGSGLKSLKVHCIKTPEGDINHATACIDRQDCIDEFLDHESVGASVAMKRVMSREERRAELLVTWEAFEAEGYSCVECVLSEIPSNAESEGLT